MRQKQPLCLIACIVFFLLAGCTSPSGRYALKSDVAPTNPISVEHIENAHPRYEPYSRGGNTDYTVLGKHYTIIKHPQGFTQTGIASWYGKKFQGHQTSNGEIYDMYSMTAAHKTLPLPSFVKVTNTDNGKSVIVRVNDRGPFHTGRIIDLSYAAAYKLGVLKTGTANVKIEALVFDKETKHHLQTTATQYFVQVVSSKYLQRLRTLAPQLSQKFNVASFMDSQNDTHQLMLGPFTSYLDAQHTLEEVKLQGYPTAFIRHYETSQQ